MKLSVGPSHTLSLAESVNGNVSRAANGIDLRLLYPLTPDQSIPDMSFNGLTNTNFAGSYLGGTPWKQANTTINANDNLTWVRAEAHDQKGSVLPAQPQGSGRLGQHQWAVHLRHRPNGAFAVSSEHNLRRSAGERVAGRVRRLRSVDRASSGQIPLQPVRVLRARHVEGHTSLDVGLRNAVCMDSAAI